MHFYEMVSSTCELSYMVWLAQRTKNTHGILKQISGSNNQEISWSDR